MAGKSGDTERHAKPRSVHVIVNPAPSRRIPLLAILNQAFRDAGIHWDVSITHGTGDGAGLARKAVESGVDVVAVYGGDGTVMEVASGLLGTDVPLLILAGGTGNLVAKELRLPMRLERACGRICDDEFFTRRIDVGMMGGHPFLLRIGCGIEVGVVKGATREMKDQLGKLAYVWAALTHIQETPEADYEIVLDGLETVRARGVACVVANAGTVGVGRLTLSSSVDICDGKLDVFLLKRANIEGIGQIVEKLTGLDQLKQASIEGVLRLVEMTGYDGLRPDDADSDASHPSLALRQWSVERVEIRTDPVLDIQVDGDVIAKTPQSIHVLPSALRVVV